MYSFTHFAPPVESDDIIIIPAVPDEEVILKSFVEIVPATVNE